LAFSAGALALIVIVALAFLSGAIVFPPLPGTSAQTLSQTVTTQETSVTTQGAGPTLQVEVDLAQNPIALGATQGIIVTVVGPGGVPAASASVHIEVISPSGQAQTFDGSTNINGQYSQGWQITASPGNVGTFQVSVSAVKSGYQSGHAQATFKATS
jgi:hypothetical protein